MRMDLRSLTLGGLLLLIVAVPLSARRIKVRADYDKSINFTRYKHYALGKNFLLTHQMPEVQTHIDQVLVDSLKRQLQAKGFVLDESHPDFVITYEAGSLAKADTSAQPDIYYGMPSDSPAFGQVGIEGIPAAVWTYTLARLKLTVTDAGTGEPVWTARASVKIQDPQKTLNDVKREADDLMAKSLQTFPPRGIPRSAL